MTLANGQLPLYATGGQQNFGGPVASGDFTVGQMDAVAGVYTLDGEPCAIGDIIDLTEDAGNFDPLTDIDAGGVIGDEAVLYLKAPLLTTLLASGFTVVFDAYMTSSAILKIQAQDHPDEEFFAYCSFQQAPDEANIDLYTTEDNSDVYTPGYPLAHDTIHRAAFTMTGTRMALSIDGGAVIVNEHPGIAATFEAIKFSINSSLDDARLRSFAFYAPADDADLPTLSTL